MPLNEKTGNSVARRFNALKRVNVFGFSELVAHFNVYK